MKDCVLSEGFLPSVFDKTNHIALNCKLNTPVKWGDLKKYKGTDITYNGSLYEIVALEYFAVSDDRETYQCGLILKIKDDTNNTIKEQV